ncbi:IrmA family protein [Acinetobacter sp.]|uniref:IrmA family protein n=1 Tax=Acinetobacter sp. TaxID=472 RepID=UPI00264A055C|nr:IrmA family protein [Acinetobacter sp.]MDN5511443.1 IrmA family protein [Acinetobacter sp.]MDN5524608.1 IrmA family protein [Acinetobacter sp.]
MKKIFIAWLFSQILFLNLAEATPITLQHVTTTYVNSGICSAAINVTIHDFLGESDKLYLDLVATDKTGKVKIASENIITYDDVQNLSGKATTNVFIESEEVCGADRTWTVQVKRAVLVADGKRQDLLKTKQVHIDDFQPMKIVAK